MFRKLKHTELKTPYRRFFSYSAIEVRQHEKRKRYSVKQNADFCICYSIGYKVKQTTKQFGYCRSNATLR